MANETKAASDVREAPKQLGMKEMMNAAQKIAEALEPFALEQRRSILNSVASLAGVRAQQGAPRQQQQNSGRR